MDGRRPNACWPGSSRAKRRISSASRTDTARRWRAISSTARPSSAVRSRSRTMPHSRSASKPIRSRATRSSMYVRHRVARAAISPPSSGAQATSMRGTSRKRRWHSLSRTSHGSSLRISRHRCTTHARRIRRCWMPRDRERRTSSSPTSRAPVSAFSERSRISASTQAVRGSVSCRSCSGRSSTRYAAM